MSAKAINGSLTAPYHLKLTGGREAEYWIYGCNDNNEGPYRIVFCVERGKAPIFGKGVTVVMALSELRKQDELLATAIQHDLLERAVA